MGHLLGRVTRRTIDNSRAMLSACTTSGENDAGKGFYKLAQELGLLSPRASADERLAFWTDQVHQAHRVYGETGWFATR